MRPAWAIARLVIREAFRKKDFYVAFIFTGVVLFYAARMRFYNAGNTYRYLLDIGLGLSVLFAAILTVALSARQFPEEIKNRTCHVLLSRPVTRAQMILGKFLGSFVSGLGCFFLFFATLLLVVLSRNQEWSAVTALETFYLFGLLLMLLSALAVFFSFFMTVSANVSITLILYLVLSVYGPTIHASAAALGGPARGILETVNLLVPHFGFFDMRQRFIHGWPPVSVRLLLFLTGYAFSYTAALLCGGWFLFRRKNIL